MLVHRSTAPSAAAWWASLHFSILHGQALTGVGWHAPGPLFVSKKMAFLLPLWILFLSQLGSMVGGQHLMAPPL